MARALKVFKTHLGFYDLVVAAPSMKAAAQAWEVKPNIFAQGFAAQTQEVDAVEAALAHPGCVLKRPHGQAGDYKADPDAIAAPKLTAHQKRAAHDAEAERKRKAAAEVRAQKAAERKAQQAAKQELRELAQAEAELRARRQTLQKKLHSRA